MTEAEPQTARALRIRGQVSQERWTRLVADARRRVELLDTVVAERAERGSSWRKSLEAAAPEVDWSTYQNWQRLVKTRTGPVWERLLDGRLPPPPTPIPDTVRLAAVMLRRAKRSITCEEARRHLVEQFGEIGAVSDASLRRFWASAGLNREEAAGSGAVPGEEVEYFNGGGGLALLGAAEAELGTATKLAAAVLEAGKARAEAQGDVEERTEPEEGRDERGRFTADYNAWWREGSEEGVADERLGTDEAKRRRRALSTLSTLSQSPGVLGARLLCMGVMPLVTERRGFVGLEGPAGSWLALLGVRAYMPRTLDKALDELGLLGVNEALWQTYARQWCEQSRKWSEGGPWWLQSVVYVDQTEDPHWTRHYALSGKVARVGRVMPCLGRVMVTSGPGVPLMVETHAGTVSLKTHLVPTLSKLDQWLGEGELGRLTVIDAEMATAGLLWTLDQELDRLFVTVLKGGALSGAEQDGHGPWQPYRQRDELRELQLTLRGEGAPEQGVRLRAVEMRRPESRCPHTTMFVTNGQAEELTTAEVATVYLSRWPHQEQVFRNARNGGGLERSHGFGGQMITNVAFRTKVDKASNRLDRAKDHLLDLEAVRDEVAAAVRGRESTKEEQRKLRTAEAEVRKAEQAVVKANNALVDQCRMPREIYARDPGRDNVMSCLKLWGLMLVEFVLKEYFGGLRMEWRTFIDQYLYLAVTVRTSRNRILHQIHSNVRQPQRMAELRAACDEINRRRLHREKRLLKFEVIDPPPGGLFPVIGPS